MVLNIFFIFESFRNHFIQINFIGVTLIMVDPNSPEFQIAHKIGHMLAIYIGARFIIKGTKMIIKSSRILFISKTINPL